MELELGTLGTAVGVGLAVCQFVKMTVPELQEKYKRFIPLVTLASCALMVFLFMEMGGPKEFTINTIMATLIASGLWSTGKNTLGK